MTEAELILAQRGRGKPLIYKALAISALLHLICMATIQPARWSGPSEVVLKARLVPVRAETQAVAVDEPLLPEPTHEQTSPEVVAPPAAQPAETAPQALAAPPDTVVSPPSSSEPIRETATTAAAGRDEAPDLPLPEVPLLVDTRWYTAREVERRPEALGEILPAYPEEARQQGIEGSVVIALHIDESGEVREVEVLESNPPGVFDAAVIAAYGQARFRPAARAGRAVRYVGKYRVTFELE